MKILYIKLYGGKYFVRSNKSCAYKHNKSILNKI